MSDSAAFRAFCAYGPRHRAPGCGWEAFADDETKAAQLAEQHGEGSTHVADYEGWSA